eukprot:gene8858-407_t
MCCKEDTGCVYRLLATGAVCKAIATTTEKTTTTEAQTSPACEAGAILLKGTCICPLKLTRTPCKNRQGFCCISQIHTTTTTLTATTGAVVCRRDMKQCSDGSQVARDPDNQCKFPFCPGTGLTVNGDHCTCDCPVCDPPPEYEAKPAAGTGLISSSRAANQAECQRACATRIACKSISFTPDKLSFLDRLKRKTPDNCKLWQTHGGGGGRSRRQRPRSARAAGDGVTVHFNKEPDARSAPAASYQALAANNNQHHNGATLLWLSATSEAACKQECDGTVKCLGVSFYNGVSDDRNCRLIGDTMVSGPWTNAADGPWSSKYIAALRDTGGGGGDACLAGGTYDDADFGSDAWRWDETVTITSYGKITNADGTADQAYEPSEHSSDEIFVGETLAWIDVATQEACMAACMVDAGCTGVSFYPEGEGLLANRCKLVASSMDDDDSWIANPNSNGGTRRRRSAGVSGGKSRRLFKRLSHFKKLILGLERKLKIEITKTFAMIRMEGSLFGTFLQSHFGVDAFFKKPRSFQCFGGMKMESKDEVLNRVKASLQETADNANAKFDAANAKLEKAKKNTVDKIAAKQAEVDAKRSIFTDKADKMRQKKDDLTAKQQNLQNKKNDLDRICKIKCCSKSCVPKWKKRQACKVANGLCKVARSPFVLALSIAQGALELAKWAVEAAATVVEAAQVVLDVQIALLEVVKAAAQVALSVAQGVLDVCKALVGFGLKLAAKIVEGAFNLFYLREFSFDFMLSKDSKYLAVYLDCTMFGKDVTIDFTLDFSSFGAAIKSLVNAIIQILKGLFGSRRSAREISDVMNARFAIPSSEWYGQVRRYAQTQVNVHDVDQDWMGGGVGADQIVYAGNGNGNDNDRRREAHSSSSTPAATKFETVCTGTCECKVCIKLVKNLIHRLHTGLLQSQTANVGIKHAAQKLDRETSVEYQEAMLVEAIVTFKEASLADRAEQRKLFASEDEECADAENVTACLLVVQGFEANLAVMEPDAALVNALFAETKDDFETKKATAIDLHQVADTEELSGWRDTVDGFMFEDTINGIGCPEVECAGLADCIASAATYLKGALDSMADSQFCPNGFNSQDGGCDESERLAQESFHTLGKQWSALLPGLQTLFADATPERSATATTLSDAFELVNKARAVVAALSPSEMCEGRIVVADRSTTTRQNSTIQRSPSTAGSRRAASPTAAAQNQLLNQFPVYSSICGGDPAALTDGVVVPVEGDDAKANPAGIFKSCNEDGPSVEIPTLEPSFISTVRVGKQCLGGNQFDGSVAGLRVQIKTSLGIFDCGKVADETDAACEYEDSGYWERRCDTFGKDIAATAVLVVREEACTPPTAPHCAAASSSGGGGGAMLLVLDGVGRDQPTNPSSSFGNLVLTEVQADGRPIAVSNVLLGQQASSTSQCHETPTYSPMTQYVDQFPSMPGSRVFDVVDGGGMDACMDACQDDALCVGVSYVSSPDDGVEKCVLSPSPLLSEGVLWKNLAEIEGGDEIYNDDSEARAAHFTKTIPLRKLEAMNNHIHDGQVLQQFCVEDISICKHRCATDARCTGFTFYGDEDDPYSPSVCALTGTKDGVRATNDFADGPFAMLPADGVSANLGRPPRLHENSEFTSTQNYAIVLGLRTATDGFYQPLSTEGDGLYARQGFLHTCGLTEADEVAIPTTEPSRVYTVRVWKRCDCCEHRAIGLQVMQQVVVVVDADGAGADGGEKLEWRACGDVSTEDDAVCEDGTGGPEQQFWERGCDPTVETRAIKVVRVISASHGSPDDVDSKAIDLPEIEAFGAIFLRGGENKVAAAAADGSGEDDDFDPGEEASTLLAKFEKDTVATIPTDWCGSKRGGAGGGSDNSGGAESTVVHTEPLITCTISTTSTTTTTTTTTTAFVGSNNGGDDENDNDEEEESDTSQTDNDEAGEGSKDDDSEEEEEQSIDTAAASGGLGAGATAAIASKFEASNMTLPVAAAANGGHVDVTDQGDGYLNILTAEEGQSVAYRVPKEAASEISEI